MVCMKPCYDTTIDYWDRLQIVSAWSKQMRWIMRLTRLLCSSKLHSKPLTQDGPTSPLSTLQAAGVGRSRLILNQTLQKTMKLATPNFALARYAPSGRGRITQNWQNTWPQTWEPIHLILNSFLATEIRMKPWSALSFGHRTGLSLRKKQRRVTIPPVNDKSWTKRNAIPHENASRFALQNASRRGG